MKVIVISTNGIITQREVLANGKPLYDIVRANVDGYMENVHPRRLPRGLIMVVNEEGLCNGLPVNPIASYLYQTDIHGQPIVGNVVIVKEGIFEDERDIVGIPDDEANSIMGKLLKIIFFKYERSK